jgi:hypothetical protein
MNFVCALTGLETIRFQIEAADEDSALAVCALTGLETIRFPYPTHNLLEVASPCYFIFRMG